MANEIFALHKLTALPATGSRTAHSIYLIGPPGDPDHCEMYVTGSDPATIKRLINKADVDALIAAAVASASGSNSFFADTIAARNAITPKKNAMTVHVVDATGDTTVKSGGATYMWRASNSSWVKISEFESMDITWAGITGGPAASPTNIDDAVNKRHAHTNMTQLNKVGEDGAGNLTYGGNLPKTAWSGVDW